MDKRGGTVLTFVLIIGVLFVGTIVFFSIKRTALWQAEETERDVQYSFFMDIINNIEKAEEYPSNLELSFQPIFSEPYTLNMTQNTLFLDFPESKTSFSKTLPVNSKVIPSFIHNSGKITLLKDEYSICLTDDFRCDVEDALCDAGCLFKKQCDKQCYIHGIKDSVCIAECADLTRDGVIDRRDSDKVCDPDCYGPEKDGVYDYDCNFDNDGVCDADTPLLNDSLCDTDCLFLNKVCDKDCALWWYSKDENNNKIPEPLHLTYPSIDEYKKGSDPDCPQCPNTIFQPEIDENCFTCKEDTPFPSDNKEDWKCYLGCSDYLPGKAPEELNADVFDNLTGFVKKEVLQDHEGICVDSCDCKAGHCSFDSEYPGEGHCCQPGEVWKQEQNKCVGGDVLIVSIKKNLLRQFGKKGLEEIEASVDKYKEALSNRGHSSMLIYLDENDVRSIKGSDSKEIKGATNFLIKKFDSKYLVILGGHGIIPQIGVVNPVPSAGVLDPDIFVYNDDGYADLDNDGVMDIPVARFASGEGDAYYGVIINQLNQAVSFEEQKKDFKKRTVWCMKGVTTLLMDVSCKTLAESLKISHCDSEKAPSCYKTPPVEPGRRKEILDNKDLVGLLCHGSPQPFQTCTSEVGQIMLDTTSIKTLNNKNSVWFIDACYGGKINSFTTPQSLSLSLLNQGSFVFGGTTMQFVTGKTYQGAEGIAAYDGFILTKLFEKETLGKSLLYAKQGYIKSCTYKGLDIFCKKTQLQNVLYGDPTLKIFS